MKRATPALLVAIALSVNACAKHDAGDPADAKVDAVVDADVGTAVTGPFTETVQLTGAVQPRPGHTAALSATAAARIVGVNAVSGQRVTRGDTLVVLDPMTFATATQAADASLRLAQQARDRAQRLVGEGIAARRDLDQTEADLARARTESAQAHRAADLAVLRAPIDGVVTAMRAVIGAIADPAVPLVEIADPSSPMLLMTATPGDAARLRAGAHVHVAPAPGDSDVILSGVVTEVGGAVDSSTRGVLVRARVDRSARELRIGESLTITVEAGVRAHAVSIPAAALIPQGDGFRVFVVDSARVAHATEVTVGARADSVVEITSGLHGGERVVTRGAFGVEDGAHIGKAKP